MIMSDSNTKFSEETLQRLEKLAEKYEAMGQDLNAYLDGLLYADYLTYWNYIHLDTLLSLQNPLTPFHDEPIFIMYHQITELYFKLILHACERLAIAEKMTGDLFLRQMQRINRYFEHLIDSFEVMIEGMDKEEFLRFRMSLLPASGFQSAQYRMIEIWSTDLHRLVHPAIRKPKDASRKVNDLYERLYWHSGATELATGKKTLTLRQFERKYSDKLKQLGRDVLRMNLWQLYLQLPLEQRQREDIQEALRAHDLNANVYWPLAHYKSAVRYLQREPKEIAATGGTNWQKYLPPKNQRVIFYPELWTTEEMEHWGRPKHLDKRMR